MSEVAIVTALMFAAIMLLLVIVAMLFRSNKKRERAWKKVWEQYHERQQDSRRF